MEFLGIDLSKVPTQSLNDWRVYIIPGLYVITSFYFHSINNGNTKQEEKEKRRNCDGKWRSKRRTRSNGSKCRQMNKSMTYMMPIMSVMIAVIAPLGLAFILAYE